MDWLLVIGAFVVLFVVLVQVFVDSDAPFCGPFVCALGIVVVGWIIVANTTGKIESNGERDIVALSTNSAVSGRFFLGSGYVGETPVYTYMYETDGGMRMGAIPAEKTTVVQTDDIEPHIVAEYKRSRWVPYLDSCDFEYSSQFRVYVPEDSVYTGFDIDVREAN